jgi:hypothetical protein
MLKQTFYRWLLIAILLGMQYATLHHAVEHLFHQTDISCSIFISADHQNNVLIQDDFNFQFFFSNQIVIFFDFIPFFSFIFQAFQARAPPL